MASFSYGFTVHCKGKQEDIDAFLESVENAENWTQSSRVSADSLSLYKEETRGKLYAPLLSCIGEFPRLSLFFELKEESNSLDNSKQCGYVIFEDGEIDEEVYFTYGHGNKVSARFAEWKGEPAPAEEPPPEEPLAELSDEDYKNAVDEYDSTGDFVDIWDGYKTPRFCLYVAGRNPKMLEFMPEQSKTREVCLTACKENRAALRFLPASLQTPDFYCEAFLGESAGKTSAEFREDRAFNRYVPKDAQERVLRLLFSEEEVDENNIEASLEYKKWSAKVERHALLYFSGVPEKFKTPALCLSVVKQEAEMLRYVPEQLKTPELCQAALDHYRYYTTILTHIPDRVKTPELCRAVVMEDADALEYTPDALKTPELCRIALENDAGALEYVPENRWTPELRRALLPHLHSSKDFSETERIINRIPDAFKTPEFCLALVSVYGRALKFVPDRLRTPELYLAAFQKYRAAIEFMPEGLKTLEICLSAVKEDHYLLEYVPENMKTAEFWLAAVKQNGNALKFAPEELRTPELCLAAVKQNGNALKFAPEELRTPELCLAAVKQNGQALRFTPEELRTPELCLAAVKQNGNALAFVPKALWTLELCVAAVEQDGRLLKVVPEDLREQVEKAVGGV